LQRTLDAIRYLENTVVGSREIEGIVLRYGAFYGPNTGLLYGPMIDQLRRRHVPLIGDADGWWSFLHVDDAAAAAAIAVESDASGIYNIVDDKPAPAREWLPALAAMLGAKPPWRIPKWLARIAAGEHIVTLMTEARAGSNAKAQRDLSWAADPPVVAARLCRGSGAERVTRKNAGLRRLFRALFYLYRWAAHRPSPPHGPRCAGIPQ
jgi:nucleoside-diphosphate-sugar epimerase